MRPKRRDVPADRVDHPTPGIGDSHARACPSHQRTGNASTRTLCGNLTPSRPPVPRQTSHRSKPGTPAFERPRPASAFVSAGRFCRDDFQTQPLLVANVGPVALVHRIAHLRCQRSTRGIHLQHVRSPSSRLRLSSSPLGSRTSTQRLVTWFAVDCRTLFNADGTSR